MALVTVQRSPSPSNSPEAQLGSDVLDGESGIKSPHKSHSFSETYLAVKGAACILPQSECLRTITRGSHGGDMQTHLQSMYYLLRNQDTIKVAVKVESMYPSHNRYLVVVSTIDRQDTEESVILGVDIMDDQATIGLVLTIWGDMTIRLDGDGGFSLATNERHHIFKPVSVQAMWSALQSLIRVRNIAQRNNYYPKGLTHTWVTYYEVRVKSEQSCINEWNAMEDIESHRTVAPVVAGSLEKAQVEKAIKSKLKAIMMAVDLEEVTSVYLRSRLEETMGMSLTEYKPFIDEEMIVIMRQMDAASEIFEYIYLGSEWNASNLEELQEQGIGNIVNMAREIDNFFPGVIEYYNVRVYDVEQADLLRHWDNTFKFINRVKQQHQKVLVHCKMGVSRSACTVMAYAMKEYGWTLEQAYQFVKQKRSCIKPNAGFMKQLIIYQGILDASKQRHNKLWRSVSVGNLNEMTRRRESSEESEEDEKQNDEFLDVCRPRSWTPHNCEQHCRKTRHTDKDDMSSSDGRQATGANAVHSPVAERSGTCGASSTGEVALFTLDEDSTTTDQNASPKPCVNTSDNQPVVDTATWCVASHGTVSSVRKVEEWMAKTPLESIVKSSAAATDSAVVDSSVESPTLSRANVRHEKTMVHCGTEEGCAESLGPTHMVHSVSAAALLTSKVRPDTSWIKEALQTMSDGATAEEIAPNSVVEDKPEVIHNIAVVDPTNQKPTTVSEDSSSSVKSDCAAESKEIGVVAHYEKELIPWNTGTVRRQTQDLEERLKSGLKLCSDTSSPVSSVGSPVSAHNDFSSVTASHPPSADLGDEPLLMSPERSSASNDMLAKKPVSSIYANEDIPLEPGIVMRTKHQIEERSKKSSDVDENRPVQRSSSWKVSQAERSHKRHDRNSDRRKTCLPVLQYASFMDNSAQATSGNPFASQPRRCSAGEERKVAKGPEPDERCEVKVYQIGSEQVEMQKDKVKRRTKDFEELSKEEQDERASTALVPATQELKRSHSPFPSNDEIEIRTGSVLEQKLTIEMKYGTVNESAHNLGESKHPDDAAKPNVDAQNNVDGDAPALDANVNVNITSDVPACSVCSTRRNVDGVHAGGASDVTTGAGHGHAERAGGQRAADYGDKCGDAECKYCSRVLDAYYGVVCGTTEDSPGNVAGCTGPTYSVGYDSRVPVGVLASPQSHRLSEFVDKNSTKPVKTNVSDSESALLYSSNYNLPGVPRKTAISHPSRGRYPTQDGCDPVVGNSCDYNDLDEDSSNAYSQKQSDFQNGPQTLDMPCCESIDARTAPVMVYEEEDITSRVRTTWRQQQAAPGCGDETAALSPTPQHKMDALTLTLIRSVASTFQCSPVRSRGIVRRIARDIESGASLQQSSLDTAPDLPKSMPPGHSKSMPSGACSNAERRSPCELYTPRGITSALLASDESPAACGPVEGDAPSQSFTSSRDMQLNTTKHTQLVDSTDTSECSVKPETSCHESSPPPTDDSRVRNLVEIFEPKDGTSVQQPADAAQAGIVKRLTWHAGDRTKPKLGIKNIAPFNETSSVESPPGRRRALTDMSVRTNVSDQSWPNATPTDGSAGDNKFATKLVELCTVPEVTSLQQQDPTEVPTQLRPMPPGDEQSCHVTGPRRPWERRIPINTQREPDPSQVPRKTRKLQGKSHPLSKLSGETSQLGRSVNPFYNTM